MYSLLRSPRVWFTSLAAGAAVCLAWSSASAQMGIGPAVPSWVGSLTLGVSSLSSDGAGAEEELPGLGHKFELYFGMDDAQDPLNVTNDVVTVDTTGGVIGVALRNLPPGIKIAPLTNQLQLKYYFPARTCAGGSPRIQLAVDRDGDGTFDGNLFGYVGHAGFGAGCVTGAWDFVDMTDLVPARWDATQLGLGYHNWQTLVAAMNATYPNHKILSGSLVDDSASFASGAAGRAYYDLLTIENRTLEQREDTVRK